MRLVALSVKNFRSIKRIERFRIEPLQGLVGENNAGKSNVLRAVQCFLSAGAGGVTPDDFNDGEQPIFIEVEFDDMSSSERNRLRSYLIGDRLIIQKKLEITDGDRSGKLKVTTEYHGYRAEPLDWWLSIDKVMEREESSQLGEYRK